MTNIDYEKIHALMDNIIENSEKKSSKALLPILSSLDKSEWRLFKEIFYDKNDSIQIKVEQFLEKHKALKSRFNSVTWDSGFGNKQIKTEVFLKLPNYIQEKILYLTEGDIEETERILTSKPKSLREHTIVELFEKEDFKTAMRLASRHLDYHLELNMKFF